jgi:hypothetical protein
MCSNTMTRVGTFNNPAINNFAFVDGYYPITAILENGVDGSIENTCAFDGGFIQVLTFQTTVPKPRMGGGGLNSTTPLTTCLFGG